MNAQQIPQPAPAAQATQAAPAPVSGEPMFEVPYADGVRKEPLSVLQQHALARSAAERQVMESNQRIVALQQQNQNLAQRAAIADRMNAQLISNPDQFQAEAERLVRMAKGEQTQEDRAAVASGHAPQNLEVLNQLKAEIDQLKAANQGTRQTDTIRNALQSYDLFKNNDTARQIAETTLAAMHANQIDTPLHELASKLHTQMAALIGGATQASYAARTERQATLPPAPAGQTPGMTAPPPPPTLKDLRDGTLGKRMLAFMRGPNGLPQQ